MATTKTVTKFTCEHCERRYKADNAKVRALGGCCPSCGGLVIAVQVSR